MDTSYDQWIGQTAIDRDGDKVGTIKDVFYDDVTGRPEWVKVKTGLLGGARFVPIAGSEIIAHTDDPSVCELRLNYSTDMIKDAPKVDEDEDDAVTVERSRSASGEVDTHDHLSADQERLLYAHYGFNYDQRTPTGTYGNEYGRLRPDADYTYAKPTTVITGVRMHRYETGRSDA